MSLTPHIALGLYTQHAHAPLSHTNNSTVGQKDMSHTQHGQEEGHVNVGVTEGFTSLPPCTMSTSPSLSSISSSGPPVSLSNGAENEEDFTNFDFEFGDAFDEDLIMDEFIDTMFTVVTGDVE